MRSRREFLRLVAAGSAAAITGSAPRVARAAARAASGRAAKSAAAPARPAAVRAEIDRQKKLTADALRTIRKHELPAGSPLAFTFRPLRPAKRER
ncbi:MAG TPA: hypothetical protein VL123_05275 [Candidatus Udaeobacter sp.]|jgi:hypothetical protein|nr:hypothetical protein [Candidatus Udaeobacter sp.]